MSQHDEDRDKVVNALGGKKGLIDSGVPAVVFLIVFNFTKEIDTATWAALSLSVTLAIIRLIMKDTIQHSVSGVIGVLICAYFANRSGNATDFYIPKLLTNLGYGTVYLIANLVGWPILGLVLGHCSEKTLRGAIIQLGRRCISKQVGCGLRCSSCESLFSIRFIRAETSIC